MKKIAILIIMLTLVFLTLAVVFASPMFKQYNNSRKWRFNANYEDYSVEFELVKDYVLQSYPHTEDKWLVINKTEDNKYNFFDLNSKDYVDCPDNISTAISVLKSKKAFPSKDSKFDAIKIDKTRVSFCISGGNYCVTWSPDEKPTWVNSPTEEHKVFVKKIGGGWYHVVINPD